MPSRLPGPGFGGAVVLSLRLFPVWLLRLLGLWVPAPTEPTRPHARQPAVTNPSPPPPVALSGPDMPGTRQGRPPTAVGGRPWVSEVTVRPGQRKTLSGSSQPGGSSAAAGRPGRDRVWYIASISSACRRTISSRRSFIDGVSNPFATSNGSGSTRKTRMDSDRDTVLL